MGVLNDWIVSGVLHGEVQLQDGLKLFQIVTLE